MKPELAEELREKVTRDYDAIAADFSASRSKGWPLMERLGALAKPGDAVLDVGCGNGRAYQYFSGRAIEYEGIDGSAALIKIAKDAHRDPLARFRVGDALALPYGRGEFDAVFCFAVVHHIPSAGLRLAAVHELARVAKPGGTVVISNWDLWHSKHAWRVWMAALPAALGVSGFDVGDALVPWKANGSTVGRYVHAFRRAELGRLARAAGLTVTEEGAAEGNLWVVARKD